ncbi:MAG: cofactor-independent phosphoglycerate mutase [Smithellaceae bacterium]|nr:cofactor-independent phosphoglycerate mutase [Smithellaceae bacterium]
MKYVIILGDGMADYPIDELGGMTPLEYARTPNMDEIAARGTLGLVDTIPEGMAPASDVANMSILGYDPRTCYSGRGPLEAASMGVELAPQDVAFRCNLVTLEENHGNRMADYTAGQISSQEASEIMNDLNTSLGDSEVKFYPGVSFRHLLVWTKGRDDLTTTPPHDITGKLVREYLPQGEGAEMLNALMRRSQDFLLSHPINKARLSQGMRPATTIWPWGQGRKPTMKRITDEYHLTGGMISAVDLLHGIARYAGLDSLHVQGATGYTDTNYSGKGKKTIEALKERDLVFVHVEAPDAMGHEGNLAGKIRAIEDFDNLVVGQILQAMPSFGDYRLMVTSDHPTPISLMTHSSDPSPFAVLSNLPRENQGRSYNFGETAAKTSGILITPGFKLFQFFINSWNKVIDSRMK